MVGCKKQPEYVLGDIVTWKEDTAQYKNCVTKGSVVDVYYTGLLYENLTYRIDSREFVTGNEPKGCPVAWLIEEDEVVKHEKWKPPTLPKPKKPTISTMTKELNKCADDYVHCMRLLDHDVRIDSNDMKAFYQDKCKNEMEMCVLRSK